MDQWIKRYLGMTTEDAGLIVAIISLLVASVVLIRPLRALFRESVAGVSNAIGLTRRRYGHWFIRKHSQLRNIYMNRIETLDLRDTYVSLSFLEDEPSGDARIGAAQIIAEQAGHNMIILGDPGTGKSTLLKAFGIAILARGRRARSASRAVTEDDEVPFFVPLRHFARKCDGERSLLNYLLETIVNDGAQIRSGRRFLQKLLKQGRCVLLLDGLDEVREEEYERVKNAIFEFGSDSSPDLPTKKARIVITCRKQNFLRIRNDWTPNFSDKVYLLAPFNDAEIYQYLQRRRSIFRGSRTIEDFLSSVRRSGTIDLHRIPLILTISVALYVTLAAYEVPNNITRFYEEMLRELLSRHDFRGQDPAGRANVFNADDKYRFLREFSLKMAQRKIGFEDFQYREIVQACEELAPKMANLPKNRVDQFVREIIDRSGLLLQVSEDDEYTFAHRSIQEYLAAVQLSRDPKSGIRFLGRRIRQPDWRQVAIFFASIDHEGVDGFLRMVASLLPELAGHCLASAVVTDEVADEVVTAIARAVETDKLTGANLSALLSAIHSPRPSVRDKASIVALDVIAQQPAGALIRSVGGDPGVFARLLTVLAESESPAVATIAPLLASLTVAGDRRTIGPMFRCLSNSVMAEHPAAAEKLVDRLLTEVMNPECLEELESQPHEPNRAPEFCRGSVRYDVYPFRHGLPIDSNLVTLLAWKQHLSLRPTRLNTYLRAMSANREEFTAIERSWRRSLIIRPFPAARLVTLFGPLAALAVCMIEYDQLRAYAVLGWRLMVLFAYPVFGSFMLSKWLAHRSRRVFQLGGNPNLILAVDSAQAANPLPRFLDIVGGINSWNVTLFPGVLLSLFTLPVTLPYALALLPLLNVAASAISVSGAFVAYFILGSVVIWLFFWFPATEACARYTVHYLFSKSRFIGIYSDPQSKHWVLPLRTTKSA